MAAKRSTKRLETADADGDEIYDEIDLNGEQSDVRYSITSYGTDFPIDSLVKRLKQGDIVVPTFDPNVETHDGSPGFQRDFVWTKRQSDRFVESLLLGFPVPGIFLFKDRDNKLLVIDGQQRLRTLEAFYNGMLRRREYELTEVHAEWRGKKYDSLSTSDRRRLDDTTIHATVVRQDEPSDLSSVYLIFERLNTGGTALTPQQIRTALYRGPFVNLIRDFNQMPAWRALVGKQRSKNLKDHELALRCLAMLYRHSEYRRPMKEFLNQFIEENQHLDNTHRAKGLTTDFKKTIEAILGGIGLKAFRLQSAVNAALAEAIFVGVATRIKNQSEAISPAKLRSAAGRLLTNQKFESAVTRSTADEDAVNTRITLSIREFAKA